MKKINWTEIVVATPAALSLASVGGMETVLVATVVIATAALLAAFSAEPTPKVVPVKVTEFSDRQIPR